MSTTTTPAEASGPTPDLTPDLTPELPAGLSPSQTVGPYLSIGLTWPDGEDVVAAGTPGAVLLRGRLLDGRGDPLPDGIIETWQADPAGRFDHPDDPRGPSTWPGFRGYGRSLTREDGTWRLRTLKPGPVPDGEGGDQAPHIDVSILGRGLLDRLVTRFYFGDEAANSDDPVLASVPQQRRATLVLAPGGTDEAEGIPVYTLDLRLQGEGETVFFAL